ARPQPRAPAGPGRGVPVEPGEPVGEVAGREDEREALVERTEPERVLPAQRDAVHADAAGIGFVERMEVVDRAAELPEFQGLPDPAAGERLVMERAQRF